MRTFADARLGQSATATAVITAARLADFCALTGEDHPLHTRDSVVPGTLLQAVASGALGEASEPWDLLGLRECRWTFRHPVRADERLHLREEITAIEEISPTCGLVSLRRTVSTDHRCATGDLTMVVRRSAS